MKKRKFYVVWQGLHPGIYDQWEDCKIQVTGYEKALYKSFDTLEEARNAYEQGPSTAFFRSGAETRPVHPPLSSGGTFIRESLAVDAACSGNPGDMEYRGVYVASGEEWFRVGPYKQGTNNIGEFLALVHGLALLKREGMALPVYSDSRNAILWVQKKKCKTQLEQTSVNCPIFDLIERAEKWLNENTYTSRILKWETATWGEIPADFGRK
jgi:ribonuclease HI